MKPKMAIRNGKREEEKEKESEEIDEQMEVERRRVPE
jgi:hypothetical protein